MKMYFIAFALSLLTAHNIIALTLRCQMSSRTIVTRTRTVVGEISVNIDEQNPIKSTSKNLGHLGDLKVTLSANLQSEEHLIEIHLGDDYFSHAFSNTPLHNFPNHVLVYFLFKSAFWPEDLFVECHKQL